MNYYMGELLPNNTGNKRPYPAPELKPPTRLIKRPFTTAITHRQLEPSNPNQQPKAFTTSIPPRIINTTTAFRTKLKKLHPTDKLLVEPPKAITSRMHQNRRYHAKYYPSQSPRKQPDLSHQLLNNLTTNVP